jgi:hypothetical protein
MSREKASVEDDDPLDRELDFSNPTPNPFARDYGRNRNLRILSPDLLTVFPDSDSMNEALRTFLRLTASINQRARKTKKSGRNRS